MFVVTHFFRAFYCFVLGLNILHSALIPGLQRRFISTTIATELVAVVVVFVVLKGTTLIRRPSRFSEHEL